jgi:serine/threonine protein phosphatase 1
VTGEIAVIGDIHGNVRALEQALFLVPRTVRRVVFVGDYVNRGQDSRAVIETLLRYRSENPCVTFLRGNHDSAFLGCLQEGALIPLLAMGGAPTIKSYTNEVGEDVLSLLRERVPQQHIAFLRSLEDTFEIDGLLVLHDPGPFSPGTGSEHRFVIGGHVVQRQLVPAVTESAAFIDTGCGTLEEGRLCCFLWPSGSWALVGAGGEVVQTFPS